ncbi:MAG TPA: tetratricopeptide repeat protein, partial [Thermoanaerobaculia bacterium]|nr:tetratricopeptide repeat protein [Thermoanaerobaculia bacterium]
MPILRIVIAKQCRQPGCKRFGAPMGVHEGFCEDCEQPLMEVFGWDLRRITLAAVAVAGAVGLALAAGALTTHLAHRPPPPPDASRSQEARHSLERGLHLAASGRFAEAREQYRRAVENDAENAVAWTNLGVANAALGSEAEALDCYSTALRIDPANWLAHYNLGLLWARRGDSEQALRHLEAAFAARPDPASRERRSMASDLRTAAVPEALRREPRFAELLAGAEVTSP